MEACEERPGREHLVVGPAHRMAGNCGKELPDSPVDDRSAPPIEIMHRPGRDETGRCDVLQERVEPVDRCDRLLVTEAERPPPSEVVPSKDRLVRSVSDPP